MTCEQICWRMLKDGSASFSWTPVWGTHRREGERERQTQERKSQRQRGDETEPSLVLPLQPPDEHPSDPHLRGPLGSTQQLAPTCFSPIGFTRLDLLWTGQTVLWTRGVWLSVGGGDFHTDRNLWRYAAILSRQDYRHSLRLVFIFRCGREEGKNRRIKHITFPGGRI